MGSLKPMNEAIQRSAWYGIEMAQCRDWVERLREEEIAELEAAVWRLEKVESGAITANEIPLPTLAPRLKRLLDEVLHGRGFVVIRALPLERSGR